MTNDPENPKPVKKMTKGKERDLALKAIDHVELRRLESGGMPGLEFEPTVVMGRPSKYDARIVTEILEMMKEGHTLTAICNNDPFRYPPHSTVRNWVFDDIDGLAARYAHARDLGLDARAEGLFNIADNFQGDVQRDRLRIDTAKWYLSKMAPKRYADRLDVTSGGEKLSIAFTKDDEDLL